MIILEGADGTGKTSLAKEIARTFNFSYQAFGVPDQPAIREYAHWLRDTYRGNYVLDRFHLGEEVYGKMWRGQGLGFQLRVTLEMMLQWLGTTIIYARTTIDETERVLETRGDALVEPAEAAEIIARFDREIEFTKLFNPVFEYNYLKGPLHKSLPYYPRFTAMAIGSRMPEVILVGDEVNPRELAIARDIPFIVGPAGEWLYRALQSEQLLGKALIFNSWNQGQLNLDAYLYVNSLADIPIIALGHQASARLTRHQISHEKIAHPSWHCRFRNPEGPGVYGKLIRSQM